MCSAILKKIYLLGMRVTGDISFSWQSGHSCSSDSNKKNRMHSSQKEFPQHGIMTASAKRSEQMEHTKSSGMSGFISCTAGAGTGLKLYAWWSNAGTAKDPLGVIIAPGTWGPSTGTMKLWGIPVLFLISTASLKK